MKKVNVVDSIMGSGKTSWAVQYIDESSEERRFVYITPYLAEIQRIKESVTTRDFAEPSRINDEGRKLRGLKTLIVEGRDIVATHSLFQSADEELVDLLTEAGYTLILDEVMDVIETANITHQDIQILLGSGKVEVGEDHRVKWISEEYLVDGRFYDIKLLAKAGNLFYHRNQFLIWAFPPQVFAAFDEVIVMTYLFDAQIQRYYYDLHGIEYEYQAVKKDNDRYVLTEYDRNNEGRTEVMSLIDLYEGRLNNVGNRRNAFGSRWLINKSKEGLLQIKNNIENYLRNICKAKSGEILWTTKKSVKHALGGKGYKGSFLHCNARATNEYADRWALAYAFNRYMHPFERSFFQDRGVTVNEELLAVSDLLQWIWRSRIRNGEPIKLYLPSSRMRALLQAWAKYEI